MPDEPAKLAKSVEVFAVEPGHSFLKGQAIKANYHGKGRYFAGQIAKVHANGTFDVAYDDGDSEAQVSIENLKPLRAKHTPTHTVDDSKDETDKADAVLTAPSTPAAASSINAVQSTPARRNSAVSEKAAVASPSASKAAVTIAAPQKLADAPTTTAVQATAAPVSSSSTSSWAHAIGDRVEAKSHGQWHSGTVVTHCASSCYGITYDTGEKEINVPEKRLRLPVQR
jgi:hypothetical protein